MRIIHGKDYYDFAMAYGDDPTTVFVRNNRRMMLDEFKNLPTFSSTTFEYKLGMGFSGFVDIGSFRYQLMDHKIVVGGRFYLGAKITKSPAINPSMSENDESFIFWNNDQFFDFCNNIGIGYSTTYNFYNRKSMSSLGEVKLTQEEVNYLIDAGIVIISPNEIGYNSIDREMSYYIANGYNLKECGFAHFMNGMEVNQEIEMWINGPMHKSDMIELSDEVKVHKHGFDKKSFRHR